MRGVLVAEYRRSGKANCACAHTPERRHGPYWFLQWRDGGKVRKRYIPARLVEAVRVLVEERKQCAQIVRECKEDLVWIRKLERRWRQQTQPPCPPSPMKT